MLTAQHFTPGTVIIEQGTTGAHCYLLIAGEVEVILKRDGENQTLLTLSQGEIFGERSMLTMQPTTASVVARDECVTLAITRADFEAVLPLSLKQVHALRRPRRPPTPSAPRPLAPLS